MPPPETTVHTRIPTRTPAPTWTPSARELADLELLSIDAFRPLDRFLDPDELLAVRTKGSLPDGTSWAADVTLTLPAAPAEAAIGAGLLTLTDPEGAPLATLRVDRVWPESAGRHGVAGPVTPLARREYGAFRRLFATPAEVRERHGGRPLLAVPLAAPPLRGDITAVAAEAKRRGARPLLLPLVGHGSARMVSPPALLRATLAAARELPIEPDVVAVLLASRGDDDQDAWLRRHVAARFSGDAVLDLYAHERDDLDAVTRAVDRGFPLPAGLVHPDVERVIVRNRPPREHRGLVVFFTGLSGSGKSTLARALHDHLLERGDRTMTLLDGDVVRRHLSTGLGFSREDRETNVRRIGYVAAEIARHGGVALCSPIAPFEETRREVRQLTEDAGGGFVLVYVATPLEECERRDRKGLYARARAGDIPDFTGISSPYEEPSDATVIVDTTGRSIDDALAEVLRALADEGWLRGSTREGT